MTATAAGPSGKLLGPAGARSTLIISTPRERAALGSTKTTSERSALVIISGPTIIPGRPAYSVFFGLLSRGEKMASNCRQGGQVHEDSPEPIEQPHPHDPLDFLEPAGEVVGDLLSEDDDELPDPPG